MTMYEDIELINLELEKSNLQIQSLHWVHVTHVMDPHYFYIRMTDYLPFIEKLEANKPLIKCSSVNINDLVIVNMNKSNEAEKYGRAKILQMTEEAGKIVCSVFLLDYGNILNFVSIENIWECDPVLRDLPELILMCHLDNCVPNGGNMEWTQKSIDAFKFYVGSEPVRMKIVDKTMNQLIVELYNTAPDDIATLMAHTGYSSLGSIKNDHNDSS